jgi:hypothetical protein
VQATVCAAGDGDRVVEEHRAEHRAWAWARSNVRQPDRRRGLPSNPVGRFDARIVGKRPAIDAADTCAPRKRGRPNATSMRAPRVLGRSMPHDCLHCIHPVCPAPHPRISRRRQRAAAEGKCVDACSDEAVAGHPVREARQSSTTKVDGNPLTGITLTGTY